jgi:hypothetical protein
MIEPHIRFGLAAAALVSAATAVHPNAELTQTIADARTIAAPIDSGILNSDRSRRKSD